MLAVYERSAHDPALATEDQLRADLLRLLDAFHWKYTFGPIRERALNSVTRWILFVLGIFFLIAALAVLYDYRNWGRTSETVSLIPLVVLAGATGASISLQNRLQRVPTTGDSIIHLFALKQGRTSLLLMPITGAIFALLAYLLFISGYVQGDLFPKIRYTGKPQEQLAYHSFGSFLYEMSPVDPVNFAKLMLFCFLAGFAERLIPDVLDRVVEKNVKNITNQMLTATSLKDMLSGVVTNLSRDKAAAEAEETGKRKEAEEKAAREKAAAEQEATRKKAEIETKAAEAKTNVVNQKKEEVDKQAALDKAAAENEATRKKQEADLKAAAASAEAETEATRKKQAADQRALEIPPQPPAVDSKMPPLEPPKSPETKGKTPPSAGEPKKP